MTRQLFRSNRPACACRRWLGAIACWTLLFCCSTVPTFAADVNGGWGSWWLPPDRSAHGHGIDWLFVVIFWITMVTFVAVELLLVVFLIKYRHRPEKKKGIFTHGNTRLEMAWTLAPALVLALLALFSKRVWDDYRYSPTLNDPNRAKVLVIGERFKWNIIYPGPDGKLGKYLNYPQPYDERWPNGEEFQGTKGPADLKYADAITKINQYNVTGSNHLGKDLSDPDGKDDVWESAQGREMVIPVNRPVEVVLGSKDVLHDFFLPNHRVKLDAVPGMRGHLVFTATMSSKEFEDARQQKLTLDELGKLLETPQGGDLLIRIDENAPGTAENKNKDRTGWRYLNPSDRRKASIIRDRQGFPKERREDTLKKLREAGVTEVVVTPGPWEIVCEELCGEGHGTMRGQLRVVTNEEYDAMKLDKPSTGGTAPPTTGPSVALNDTK